jgi:hypothetical protein
MRFIAISTSLVFLAYTGTLFAGERQPQPTDPLSSSRAPDPKPKTGNSTFDAPDKPPGPWGEIPGGGGPSGYNDGAGQKAPQYEGEKFKSAQQSERDTMEKPGGTPAADSGDGQQRTQSTTSPNSLSASSSSQSADNDGAKDGVSYEQQHPHHRSVSPGHLGPEGGSTADSGKAKRDEQARAQEEASKSAPTVQ